VLVAVIVLSLVVWVAHWSMCPGGISGAERQVIWVLVIVFAHGIGALVYFAVGRKQGALPGQVAAV